MGSFCLRFDSIHPHLKELIIFWDLKKGETVFLLDVKKEHMYQMGNNNWAIKSIYFSPNGTKLASGCTGGIICQWLIKAQIIGHTKLIFQVNFSPDCTTLASASVDKSVCLLDVKTGQQKALLDGHTDCVFSVCFSPDGTKLASSNGDKSIRLYDIKKEQKTQLDGQTKEILSACFSPDSTKLATCKGDKSIRLWNVKKENEIVTSDSHQKGVLEKLLKSIFKTNLHLEVGINFILNLFNPNIPVRIIAPYPYLLAYGTLILQGKFESTQGKDLRILMIVFWKSFQKKLIKIVLYHENYQIKYYFQQFKEFIQLFSLNNLKKIENALVTANLCLFRTFLNQLGQTLKFIKLKNNNQLFFKLKWKNSIIQLFRVILVMNVQYQLFGIKIKIISQFISEC